jgi:hypothetical protein
MSSAPAELLGAAVTIYAIKPGHLNIRTTRRLLLRQLSLAVPGRASVFHCEVGRMDSAQSLPTCPNCRLVDAPRLIVRGSPFSSATPAADVHLRCRFCGHEWSELSPEQWAS